MSDDHKYSDTNVLGGILGGARDTLEAEEPSGDPNLGRKIAGRYRLVDQLGQGGAGVVYKAVDEHGSGDAAGDTIAAVKLLHSTVFRDETMIERFKKEVAICMGFDHHNLVKVHDCGTTDRSEPYVVMEYVRGGALSGRIYDSKNPLTFPEMLLILRDVARGMAEAHAMGIVHRDLKPDNILLTGEGMAKVADFGLAREIAIGNTITGDRETVGTPYYMSPEQFRFHRVDERADIYSLGIMAFEMATRKKPFHIQVYEELARAHRLEPLPSFYVKESSFPKWFETFAFVCANKSRKRRPQSMMEIASYLEQRMARMGLIGGDKGAWYLRLLSTAIGEG